MAEQTLPGQSKGMLSGLLTFLIADVRGYTKFTLEHGDEAAARLALRFAELTDASVAVHGGQVVELRGDEALAVFPSAREALRAAVELQIRFAAESTPELPLSAGIGIDAGEAIPVGDGFRGAALNLAARLCSLASQGEVLASDTVTNLARKIDGLEYADRGGTNLKGFDNPVRVMAVLPSRPSVEASPPSATEEALPIGGFLGALPPGMLLARETELSRLQGAMDAVASGLGRLIMLTGEPGVGKTRLAQEAMVQMRNRGFLVATGRCYEPHQAVPFYPFLEAVHSARAAAPSEVSGSVPTRWPQLARLLPDLGIQPPPGLSAHEEQQRLFWAVGDFLQAVAERAPLAVLLDDLHWADSPSLELLQHLAEHTRQAPILILGTYRDSEAGEYVPLRRTLLDLERERLVETFSLHRLARDDTAALVALVAGRTGVETELAGLVYQRTDGNPFFTEELVRSLLERGDPAHFEEDIVIPETVRSVIAQRIARLPEDAQEVLREASVLGQTFAFDDLQTLTGRDEDAVDDALARGMASGLVREMGRDAFIFNHALTQQALYLDIPRRRRRRLHGSAAEMILGLPESDRTQRASELASHLLEAGEDTQALPYVILLGDQAASAWSHRDAARQYQRALDLAVRVGDMVCEAEVCERMGGLLTATIRYPEALEMLERAADRYQALGMLDREGRVVAQIGRVHLSKGSVAEGIVRVRKLLDRPSTLESLKARAGLSSSLAKLWLADGKISAALEDARIAESLAQEVDDAGLLSEATITAGMALLGLGRLTESLDTLLEGQKRAAAAADLFGICRALQKISHIHLLRDELALSRSEMEEAHDLAERMDNGRQQATTLYWLGIHDLISGDRAAARQRFEHAAGIIEDLSASWSPAFHLGGLALVALADGKAEEGSARLREFQARSADIGDAEAVDVAAWALDQAGHGRTDAAADRLLHLLMRTHSEGYARSPH